MARVSAADLAGLRTGISRRDWGWATIPALTAAFIAWFPVFSGDIWMHLASARLIIETGAIPKYDTFLYTATGNRWIDHSWLSQLFFYGAYGLGEAHGLALARALLTVAAVVMFWRLAVQRGASAWQAALLASGLACIAAPYLIARPLLFAPICAAGLLLLLHRPTWFHIAGALAVQLSWANLHASFPLGLVIIWLAAIEALGHRLARGSDPRDPGLCTRLLAAALAAPLLCLLNPNGLDLYLYVYQLASLEWVHQVIEEWRPPEWWRGENQRFAAAALLIWAAIGAGLARRKRACWTDLALLALITWQACTARRFILTWSYLAIAPAGAALAGLLPNRRRMHALTGLLLACLAGYLILEIAADRLRTGKIRGGLDAHVLPVAAVRYLIDNGIEGNIACAQYAGGYLTWAHPRARPATDGRCLVNDPETIRAFNALGLGLPGWEKAFPAPGVSDVMLIENSYHDTPLHTLKDAWRVVYYDDHWVIWLRLGGAYDRVIAAHDMTIISPNVLQHVYLELDDAGRTRAREQLIARIRHSPCGVAYAMLGHTEYIEAVICLTRASALEAAISMAQQKAGHGGDPQRLRQEATDLERQALARLRVSLDHFDADLLLNPGAIRSLFGTARSLVWLGQADKAKRFFAAAGRQDPRQWVHAEASVAYAARSLAAIYGTPSLESRGAREILQWIRDRDLAARSRAATRQRGERTRPALIDDGP